MNSLRLTFASDVSVYNPEMLAFLDETGTDRRIWLQHPWQTSQKS